MNREIKFRAWNKDQCRMWMDVQTAYDYMAGPDDANNGESIPATTFGEILRLEDEWIPMQFTGLHDKNGVEIYEGDIVHSTGNDAKYVVQFGTYRWGDYEDEFHHGWCLKRVGEIFIEPMGNQQECGEFLTVIGNIHENSENEQ